MHSSAGKRLAAALAAALSVATITAFAVAPLTEQPLPPRLLVVEPLHLSPTPLPVEGTFRRQAIVTRGESLGTLLKRLGDQDRDLVEFVRTDPQARRMLRLSQGTTVQAEVDASNRIRTLAYPLESAGSPTRDAFKLVLRRGQTQWQSAIEPVLLERTLVTRTATITTSLFSAADQAGIPDAITARLPEVFASDMDFHRDVRKGDRLRIVYEMFSDPSTLTEGRPGRIVAAEYQPQDGRRLEAVWFERSAGEGDYYGFDGRTLKKTFLRAPIEFTRISSGFSTGRRHPVFRDWRAHRGIDYAAPTGTRILSVGEGVVEFAGVQRGYGNVVIVRHDRERATLYAHMSRVAPNLAEGRKVAQGQLIGFVGQTGWASGPHLHFEFQVNGESVDPQAAMPVPDAPMDAQARLRFREATAELLERMRWNDATRVAAFE